MLVRSGIGGLTEEFPNVSAHQVSDILGLLDARAMGAPTSSTSAYVECLIQKPRGMLISTDGLVVEVGVDVDGIPRIVYDIGPSQSTRTAAWAADLGLLACEDLERLARNNAHASWLVAHRDAPTRTV